MDERGFAVRSREPGRRVRPWRAEDLGDGRVGATNHQVYRWKESGELAYERRARIEYVVRGGKIVRYEASVLDE